MLRAVRGALEETGKINGFLSSRARSSLLNLDGCQLVKRGLKYSTFEGAATFQCRGQKGLARIRILPNICFFRVAIGAVLAFHMIFTFPR